MGLQAELGELHAFGSFPQGPGEGGVEGDVFQEQLPLDFEGVVVAGGVGGFVPAGVKVQRAVDVGVPDGFRRSSGVLGPALAQANDGGATGAVHLHGEEVVAADADVPRGVELADDAGLGFEQGVGAVVGGAGVGLAVFTDALGDVGGGMGEDVGDLAEQVIDDVAPVAVHVDDDAAAVFAAVVPARALGGLVVNVAGENPVAELAAHGQQIAKETLFFGGDKFADARQPEFVLHGAVFHARGFGFGGDAEGICGEGSGGFLAIHVLASSDGFFQEGNTVWRAGGVEKDLISGVAERGVEVGGELLHAMRGGEVGELVGVAAGQDNVGHEAGVAVDDAALFLDSEHAADEVLVGAHASGDAVEDDADFLCFHGFSLDRIDRIFAWSGSVFDGGSLEGSEGSVESFHEGESEM